MDRAEAIKRLEDLITTWDGDPFVQKIVDAFKLAIAALREQEQKPLTKKSVGDTVWWVHCTNKVYKGTIARIDCCEYQGALYCLLDSPSFKINPTPVVHYSDVFDTREKALEFAEYQKENPDGVVPMCMGCHYSYSRKLTEPPKEGAEG